MKIWITRKSASELQFGGLDRLQVWLKRPNYYFRQTKIDPDGWIFDGPLHVHGIRNDGWSVGCGSFQTYIPFAKMFGYADRESENENEFALWVWEQVGKHFDDKPFDDWDKLEREFPEKYRIRDFMIEVDIDITVPFKNVLEPTIDENLFG